MTNAVAQVLDKIPQELSTPSVATLLFDLSDPAHRVHVGVTRLFHGHACGNVFADLLLKMLAKLFFRLLIHLIGMEKERKRSGRE
ncbi:MAG: hypothetical protein QOJ51_1492 [Acidobacteriaceae bacterium]|nr:hypothetical protein [Acidobacteriaceae bacterium]MDX6461384.1 hypothetical protein [Acidobacteriaceae bacterium]MEA2258667.1 hypothetical protein [Acidobacteriaceae bacterium]